MEFMLIIEDYNNFLINDKIYLETYCLNNFEADISLTANELVCSFS